jgi:aspartate racemase
MAQPIGIVAGSAEGAALRYPTICLEGVDRLGPHNHAEISMHSHAFAEDVNCIGANDWAGVADLLFSSSQKPANAGAAFLIAPVNTIYPAFVLVEHRSPRPWLHLAVEVAKEAKRCHYKRLGVLGTSQRMQDPVYRDTLNRAGTDHRVPGDEQRQRLNRIIFDQLVKGEFLASHAGQFDGSDAQPERGRLRRRNPELYGNPAARITGGGSAPDARFGAHLGPIRVAQSPRRVNV